MSVTSSILSYFEILNHIDPIWCADDDFLKIARQLDCMKPITIYQYILNKFNLSIFIPTAEEQELITMDSNIFYELSMLYGMLLIEKDLFKNIVTKNLREEMQQAYGKQAIEKIEKNSEKYFALYKKMQSMVIFTLSDATNSDYSNTDLSLLLVLAIIRNFFPNTYDWIRLKYPISRQQEEAINLNLNPEFDAQFFLHSLTTLSKWV